MKITAFRPLDSDVAALGLKRFEMKRLGRIVILAGPNGSGKTRVLSLLGRSIDPNTKRLTERQKMDVQIGNLLTSIRQETERPTPMAVHIPDWEAQLVGTRATIAKLDCIAIDEPVEQIRLIDFVPAAKDLQDPSNLAPSVLSSNAAQAENPGASGLDKTAPAYIQHLQNKHWEVTHPGFQGTAEEKSKVEADYARLELLISATLNTKLERTSSGECKLFGRPIGKAQLSRGQTVLLQFVVAVHPVRSNDGLVLMMDEPETHLHPSALISIIDKIQEALPACQIWMATHSVPLIAHLYADHPEALHFVEGGAVTHAGRKPEIVLRGLVGNEEERMKLLGFSQLPDEIAATQFAAACLAHPDVVGHQNDEPQVAQIKSALLSAARGQPVKLLDFGAGKGRLLAGLDSPDSPAKSIFDYFALEISDQFKSECEGQISSVYGDPSGRWFCGDQSLLEHLGENAFDVVVVCNVLHEISPDYWLNILGPGGSIEKFLKPGGYLLIVEDLRMPIGELPNPSGFFLFDTPHLDVLFNISADERQDPKLIVADARGDGRLKAHAIPREFLKRVSDETLRNSIAALLETSRQRLTELRSSKSTSFAAGLSNGLWTQQFANCSLYLSSIEKS